MARKTARGSGWRAASMTHFGSTTSENALVRYEERTYEQECEFLRKLGPCKWSIDVGFVPNMKVRLSILLEARVWLAAFWFRTTRVPRLVTPPQRPQRCRWKAAFTSTKPSRS